MKSKEEIEDIANKEYGEYAGYHKASFTKGYTKCQEDIRKDWQNYTVSEKCDFIELLNKQD
jgi:hypothetical protein